MRRLKLVTPSVRAALLYTFIAGSLGFSPALRAETSTPAAPARLGALTLEPSRSSASPGWLNRAVDALNNPQQQSRRESDLRAEEWASQVSREAEQTSTAPVSPAASRPLGYADTPASAAEESTPVTALPGTAPTDYFVGYGTNAVATAPSFTRPVVDLLASPVVGRSNRPALAAFSAPSVSATQTTGYQAIDRNVSTTGAALSGGWTRDSVSGFRTDVAAPSTPSVGFAAAASPARGGFTDLAATAPVQVRPAPLLVTPQPQALPSGVTMYISELNGLITQATGSGGAVSAYKTINSNDVLLGITYTNGSLFVVDQTAASIVRVVLSTGTVSTFASLSTNSAPTAIAADSSSNLFVSLTASNAIARITPAGAISTFVSLAAGASPGGLAFGPGGNLYVANDNGGSTSTSNPPSISRITPQGVVTTLATISGSVLGGVAVDAAGNVFAVDQNTGAVYRVTQAGVVSTYANLGSNAFALGLTIDANGVLYAAVTGAIAQISTTGVVSTFATDSNNPAYLTLVPEPTTYLGGVLLLGTALLVIRRRVRLA